jgi:hypothetical protein
LSNPFQDLLARFVAFLEGNKTDYMLIGGFALPSYGAIRTTVDLDIAARIQTESDFRALLESAPRWGFRPPAASLSNPVVVFADEKTGLEVELWLRPDGIAWDQETLRRRTRTRMGSAEVYLVSPEDFIVSKLARPDRGVQDEKDAKSVLARMGDKIDRKYLERRAANAGVLAVLGAVERV